MQKVKKPQKIKRLILLIMSLVFCLLFTVPAAASSADPGSVAPDSSVPSLNELFALFDFDAGLQVGYTITDYKVDAVLNKDTTVNVTEEITVDFDMSSRGIYRVFPLKVNVEQEVGGALRNFKYNIKISDVRVQGEPYTNYTERGFFIIRTGEETKFFTGEKKYIISYNYTIGNDRISDYDLLFFSLSGDGWDTTIEKFSFSFTFPEGTDLSGLQLFSGGYGSVVNDAGIVWQVNNNVVTGASYRALRPGEAVSIYTRLPEGYFIHQPSSGVLPAYLCFILVLAIAAYAVISTVKVVSNNRRRPVATVEFYPPDGISSADVGYIIDGTANDKDLLSLIIWFADRGYLTLTGNEKNMTINKVKELEPSMPSYMRTIFNAIFGTKNSVNMKKLPENFYTQLQAAKIALSAHFSKEKALYVRQAASSWAVIVFLAILTPLTVFFSGAFVEDMMLVFACISLLPLIGGAITANMAAKRWLFSGSGGRAGYSAGVMLCGVLMLLLAAGMMFFSVVLGAIPFIACIAGFIGCVVVALRYRLTGYGAEISGKLLGLKNFIAKAELPRIEKLVDQDPEYFYHVLPYAYVFGLTDKWADQFEALAVPPPAWYRGADMSSINTILLVRALNRNMTGALSNAVSSTANAAMKSGSGGSFGGGGGGFSGGGFGGGGGGRW